MEKCEFYENLHCLAEVDQEMVICQFQINGNPMEQFILENDYEMEKGKLAEILEGGFQIVC